MLKSKIELVNRKSQKSGNLYTALEITFENGYKKLVFLDNAEVYMLTALSNASN